ncbi:MAG: DUF4450 domain-containing protein, partial [Verrucomicrobiae bacterium]|nr:DUF4450 domain-containing protein [Verrucomicrobiae bacterium]
ARYRPGAMLYEICDRLLGSAPLQLTVLPMAEAKGLVARVELSDAKNKPVRWGTARTQLSPGQIELVCAFGGANGMRGRRGGDIGCEREPVSKFFQLRPEQCRDNRFVIRSNGFILLSKVATLAGVASSGARFGVGDARHWTNVAELIASARPVLIPSPEFGQVTASASAGTATPTNPNETKEAVATDFMELPQVWELPVAVGLVGLSPGQPTFIAVKQVGAGQSGDAPAAFPIYAAEDLVRWFAAALERQRKIAHRVVVDTPDPFVNAAAAALCIAADAIWDEDQGVFMHGAVAWRSKLLGWRGPYAGDALGWHDRARRHFSYWAGQQVTNPPPEKLPPPDADSNLARSHAALHTHGALSTRHYDMNLVYVDALFRHLLWTGDIEFARELWPVLERHFAWERRLFRRPFGNEQLPLYEAYAAIWASDDIQYHGGGVAYTSAYNYWHNKMAARIARLLGKDAAPYEQEAELIWRAMRELLWLQDRGWFAEFKDWLGLQLVHPSCGVWSVYHTIDSDAVTPIEAWQMTRYIDTQIPHLPIHGPNVPDEGLFTISTTTWMPYTWSVNNVVMAESLHTALAYWQANRPDTAFRLFKGALLDSMFMGLCPGNLGMTTPLDVARREAQRDFADAIGVCARALVEGLFGVRPDALAGELLVRPGFPAHWKHARIQHPDFDFEFRRTGLTETYSFRQRFARPMLLVLEVPALREMAKDVRVNGKPAPWRVQADAVGMPRIQIVGFPGPEHTITFKWSGRELAKVHGQPDAVQNGHGLRATADAGEVLRVADPQSALTNLARSPSGFTGVAIGQPGHRTVFAKIAQGDLSWWAPVTFEVRAIQPEPKPAPTDWRTPVSPSVKFEPVDLTAYFNDAVTQIFKNEYLSPRSPFCSLAIPKQGIGGWATCNLQFEVDDSGLRAAAATNGGKIFLPNGVPFATPTNAGAKNVIFVSQWDNYPDEVSVLLHGRARRAFLLMAGSTNPMQSRIDNGEVVVTYADGSSARLALHNPTTWWPIEQDYFIDDYAFRLPGPLPPRVDLKTGKVRILDAATFKGKGGKVEGGAATVLALELDPGKELRSLTVRALANEVVIGLMAVTLQRE